MFVFQRYLSKVEVVVASPSVCIYLSVSLSPSRNYRSDENPRVEWAEQLSRVEDVLDLNTIDRRERNEFVRRSYSFSPRREDNSTRESVIEFPHSRSTLNVDDDDEVSASSLSSPV